MNKKKEVNKVNYFSEKEQNFKTALELLNQQQNNQKVNLKNPYRELSINEFRKLVLFRFESFTNFGKALGVSKERAWQICHAVGSIPKKKETINRIADVTGIDAIILTKLFEKIRNERNADSFLNKNSNAGTFSSSLDSSASTSHAQNKEKEVNENGNTS